MSFSPWKVDLEPANETVDERAVGAGFHPEASAAAPMPVVVLEFSMIIRAFWS